MQTFRDKYNNSHLALNVFHHARHLSITLYVFGCTMLAYNELIKMCWHCFCDVRSVCNALEEMQVNGIDMDTQMRRLVETICRQFGEWNMWEEETNLNTGEVWALIGHIEQLIACKDIGRN